jgi:hypothetical protein
MKLFWNYSGPMLCLFEGSGSAIGGGKAGDYTKETISETKDNSATAGGDNYGGGEGNNVTVNSDAVALEGLKTVQQLEQSGVDIFKAFATQNFQLADNTNQRLSDLATTQATGGSNIAQKTILIVLAIGGAVLVLPSLLKNK